MGGIELVSLILFVLTDIESASSFMSTEQDRHQQESFDLELQTMIKHLIAAFCICIVELTFFCYFRAIFKFIYLPRSYLKDDLTKKLPDEFFAWVAPTLRSRIDEFYSLGLDTYLFLRFVGILLLFFSTFGMFNLVVLGPLNFYSSVNESDSLFMEKLSVSNISQNNSWKLNTHCLCAIITIIGLSALLIYELDNAAKIRQAYVWSEEHNRHLNSKILLLGNVPNDLRDEDLIKSSFSSFPGGVEQVWFVDDFRPYWWMCVQAEDSINSLEEMWVQILKNTAGAKHPRSHLQSEKRIMGHPPTFTPLLYLPGIQRTGSLKIGGWYRALLNRDRVDLERWSLKTLADSYQSIHKRKRDLGNGNFSKSSQVFLRFKFQVSAHMAHQSTLSQELGLLNKSIVDVHPDDIIWWNVLREETTLVKLQRYLICPIFFLLCAIDTIPVTFITILSRLPTLSRLIPLLGWLNSLPRNLKIVVSSLLPSLLLNLLTDVQNSLLRKLVYFKGMWTGSEIELNIQKWFFVLMYVQQFLVVSILSSIYDVMSRLLSNPSSIPILFVTNIPRSGNFFFKFLAVKAFAICGGNFLRLDQLLLSLLVPIWREQTPRVKWKRLTYVPRIKWGSIYSSISVYGSIGITFCVISPLISIFMIIVLFLILICYKYLLKHIFDRVNPSETYGRLYPQALFQLYTGVYCLEFSLIGILLSRRNNGSRHSMRYQAVALLVFSAITIIGNIYVYCRFRGAFECIPPNLNSALNHSRAVEKENEPPLKMEYHHPCYSYEKPKLWIPDDGGSLTPYVMKRVASEAGVDSALSGILTAGARLVNRKYWIATEVDSPC